MAWFIFFLFTALLIGIELLLACKRPLVIQSIRAASHILSIIAAFLITKLGGSAIADVIFSLPHFAQIGRSESESAQIKELISSSLPIAYAVVAPLVFLLIWIFTGIIFYIIYKIVAVILKKKAGYDEYSDSTPKRTVSMVIGGLMAVFISFTIWMPLAGYVVTADNMAEPIIAASSSDGLKLSENGALPIKNAHRLISRELSAFRFINSATGFLFRGLTSYTICGEMDNIYHDLPIGTEVLLNTAEVSAELISDISSDVSESISNRRFDVFSDENIKTLRDIAGELNRSLACKSIVAYVISGASRAVNSDSDYISMQLLLDTDGENAEQNEKINEFIKTIAKMFENTAPNTVCVDLNKMADMIRDIRDAAAVVSVIYDKEADLSHIDIKPMYESISPDSAEAIADAMKLASDISSEENKNFRGSMLLMSDAYRAMGKAKSEATLSTEEYEKEAQAISNIISMVKDDERSEQEMLKIYSDSTIIKGVVKNAAESGNENMFELSDEYVTQLENELKTYIEENGSSEDISALAQLFGIKLN